MKILILVLIPCFLFSSTLFVDNFAPAEGDGSINSPFNSIQHAIDNAQPGDSIILRGTNASYGQIYFEDIDLNKSGTAEKKITLKKYKQEIVVISILNSFTINADHWNFSGLIFENPESAFTQSNFSAENNKFIECVFRTASEDFFDRVEQQTNQFKYCRVEFFH